MSEILDSGERREFLSGAVRDIQEGKGKCNLLPLDVVSRFYEYFDGEETPVAKMLCYINDFMLYSDPEWLYKALKLFCEQQYGKTSTMFLEVSKHFEDGAKKYGEYNWQKGIPLHCYIDSALRHYFKWLRGDTDEPHDRAFVWNIMCGLWTLEHKPEMNDLPNAEKNTDES